MKIFLSSETDLIADKIISPLRKTVSTKIEVLLSSKPINYYGTDISTLCIISTCVSDDFLKDSNWKERVRYSKKDGSTDIRLNMNYTELISSPYDKQYDLYIENIVQSIQKFSKKYPKLDFKSEMLVDDIIEVCTSIDD